MKGDAIFNPYRYQTLRTSFSHPGMQKYLLSVFWVMFSFYAYLSHPFFINYNALNYLIIIYINKFYFIVIGIV
jgi:hypothetical protein